MFERGDGPYSNVQPWHPLRSSSPFGDNVIQVMVPEGVKPGQPFAVVANGQRVMITCPPKAKPGQKIQFRLPIKMTTDQITSIKLSYENAGWARCLNADLEFKWVKQGGKDDEEDQAPEVGDVGRMVF